MLAYTLKEIISLVPEAMPLVKQAHISQDMPLDNRDSCIASALQVKYLSEVEYRPVDVFALEKVAKAVKLYGVQDIVDDLSAKLVKAAQEKQQEQVTKKDELAQFHVKQASFESEMAGFANPAQISEQAQAMYKQAQELNVTPSDQVLRYSGHGYLDKQAAIQSLAARFQASQSPDFVKIAQAIYKLDTCTMKPETVQDICSTVSKMDYEAGLSARGFDFYKEAVLVKQAEIASALKVTLCGKAVPYESIARLGRDTISQYVGEDVAKDMDAGPLQAKQVLEALPLDLQRLICDLIQNS